MKRFRSFIVGASIVAFLFASLPGARASQGSCILPTTGTVSGLAMANDINGCFGALLSLYSGANAIRQHCNTTNTLQIQTISWIDARGK